LQRASELKTPSIACLGLTYKPDVDDLRESPAIEVVEKLAACGVGKLMVVEPHVNRLPPRLDHPGLQLEDFEMAIRAANLIVLLVGHQAFLQVDRDLIKDKFVIDTVGAW